MRKVALAAILVSAFAAVAVALSNLHEPRNATRGPQNELQESGVPARAARSDVSPELKALKEALRSWNKTDRTAFESLLSRLENLAISDTRSLLDLVLDDTFESPLRAIVAAVLTRNLVDSQLGLLAEILVPSTPPEILMAVFHGMTDRKVAGLESEMVTLLNGLRSAKKPNRSLIVAGIKVLAAMPGESSKEALLAMLNSPDWRDYHGDLVRALGPKLDRNDIARVLALFLNGSKTAPGEKESLQSLLDGLGTADPVLMAQTVGSLVASLPQSTTEEINAKNRIVATLMTNKSDLATAVLEAIVLTPDGKHAQIQALHALANVERERTGEILIKVLSTATDPLILLEAARVAARLKSPKLDSFTPVLEQALASGRSNVALTLAASLLEASNSKGRTPEFIAVATRVAEAFPAGGGKAAFDLGIQLAEYSAEPGQRVTELFEEPSVRWRVLKSGVMNRTDLPQVIDILIRIVNADDRSETPDRERLKAADRLVKSMTFDPIREGLFTRLEKSDDSPVAVKYARLIRTHGQSSDVDRLNRYIESLPKGPGRQALQQDRAVD